MVTYLLEEGADPTEKNAAGEDAAAASAAGIADRTRKQPPPVQPQHIAAGMDQQLKHLDRSYVGNVVEQSSLWRPHGKVTIMQLQRRNQLLDLVDAAAPTAPQTFW
jgi:hypothetical protein